MKKLHLMAILIGAVAAVAFTVPATSSETKAANEGSQAMYRMYNLNSGEHFYTADINERKSLQNAGWNYEGIGWYAPEKSNIPVYRLYNKIAGDHHYTTNAGEKDALVRLGWSSEGVGWYSSESKAVPLYRQYNPNAQAGAHNFTTGMSENDALVQAGWKAEGVAWYAIAAGKADPAGIISTFNGTDYSSIYDFNYYSQHHKNVVNSLHGSQLATLQYFARQGMAAKQAGKATFSPNDYNAIYNKTHPYPEADSLLNRIGWDLNAAFMYAQGISSYHGAELGEESSPWTKSSMWYFNFGQQNGKGNCYVKAGTFTILARELGYEATQIGGFVPYRSRNAAPGPHSWVEIKYNGAMKVCDPAYYRTKGIGWMINYGQSGTYRYDLSTANKHVLNLR